MKKSQITVFIILGLIIVLSLGTAMYVKQLGTPSTKPLLQQGVLTSADPVKKYVEQCVEFVADEPIKTIAMQGGKLNPKEFTYLNNKKISYFCIHEIDNGCVNTLTLRQDIENDLAAQITKKLPGCVDLDIFRSQGFQVTPGEITTKVDIADGEVFISVNYPLKLRKKGIDLNINDFSAKIESPLGILYKLAVEITNEELTKNTFSQTEFMKDHDVVIEKTRPYPDIIYKLSMKKTVSEELTFQFALNGEDTVTNVGYSFYGQKKNKYGSCHNPYDNLCYENTDKLSCETRKGIYLNSCENTDFNSITTDIEIHLDCKNTYNRLNNNWKGPSKQHGESWCTYDSVTGSGDDLVGSRQYVHYCIDSKEYVEPCRDYREEVCVEKKIISSKDKETITAQCRPNRWQDCIECTSEQCCTDSTYRDCNWNNFETEKKCTPAVAPGFKFWGGNAIAMCTRANLKKECDGFTCGQKWVDDSARLCYMQGDCGNYRNIHGILTKYGYINTDFKYQPTAKVFSMDIKNFQSNINLEYDKTSSAKKTPYTYTSFINNHAELLSAGLSYVDEIGTLSVIDFINPFTEKPPIHILDVSLCGVWQAPPTPKYCDYCTKNPLRPCTEYYCHSLGTLCTFDYNKGDPVCKAAKADDTAPPFIEIDNEAMTNNYEITNVSIIAGTEIINGFKVTPSLKPHTPFILTIKADEPVTCKLAMTPVKKFNDLPSFYLGSQQFDTKQNITMRVPPNLVVPQKIMDAFNFSHYTEIAQILEGPEDFINNYKEKYNTAIKYYKVFTGDDITEKIDKIGIKISKYINKYNQQLPYIRAIIDYSLNKFENNTYLFYIKCMDESGNENEEPLFIEFKIDDNMNDTTSPLFLGASPENNSLIGYETTEESFNIYLDEPSECRWSYDDLNYGDMQNEFECVTSDYELSSNYGGSYECTGSLKLNNDETKIFIRCKDKPEVIEEYSMTIEKGAVNHIITLGNNLFLNYTEPNEIYASTSMLREDRKIITKENELSLHLFKETSNLCWYEYGTTSKDIDFCIKNFDLHLGLYECTETINLNELNKDKLRNFNVNIDLDSKTIVNDVVQIFPEPADIILWEPKNLTFEFAEEFVCKINATIEKPIECTGNQCYLYTDDYVNNNINNNISLSCKPTNLPSTYQLKFKCPVTKPEIQNTNEESFVYVLRRSDMLDIISTSPEGELNTRNPELTVKTSRGEGVSCSYKTEFGISYVDMDKDANIFTAQLKDIPLNLNTYIVRCTDEYDNKIEEKIEFYVVD